MAACGSLRSLFDNPIPDNNPTFIHSLSSWKTQTKPTVASCSFTEIFGELNFKEKATHLDNSASSSSSSSSSSPEKKSIGVEQPQGSTSMDSLLGRSNFPSLDTLLAPPPKSSSEWLQLCTEGLGFESSDNVEDSMNDPGEEEEEEREERPSTRHDGNGDGGRMFPPPISCLRGGGKPWIWLKSYKGDGRFVLRDVRIPPKRFLHASREDGRLRLHLVQPDVDVINGDDEDEDEEEEK